MTNKIEEMRKKLNEVAEKYDIAIIYSGDIDVKNGFSGSCGGFGLSRIDSLNNILRRVKDEFLDDVTKKLKDTVFKK